MAPLDHDWPAWISAAMSGASRWLSAGSLVLVLGATAVLATSVQAGITALAALSLVVALGAVQIYLAVRIEFDRAIFRIAAERADGFRGFDAALRQLRWVRGASDERTPEARAAGLRALIACSGRLLAAQFALVLAAFWLLR
jgi:hypothetical protein